MHSLYFVNSTTTTNTTNHHQQQQQQQQHSLQGQSQQLSSQSMANHENNPIQQHQAPPQPQQQPPSVVIDQNNHHHNSNHQDASDHHQDDQMLIDHHNHHKTMRQRPQIEGVTEGLSHIVQWLIDTYEMADGESLPRSIVYTHYQEFCSNANVDPVNPASFGKLIRTVFAGLKTRRLGTRGNSKYHYFGIKAKSGSLLIDSSNAEQHEHSLSGAHTDQDESPNHDSSDHANSNIVTTRKKVKTSTSETSSYNIINSDENNQRGTTNNNNDDDGDGDSNHNNQDHDHHHMEENNNSILQAYLGDFTNIVDNNWLPSSQYIESYNDFDDSSNMITIFEKNYKAHYQELLNLIYNLRFNQIEKLWYQFWHPNCDDTTISTTTITTEQSTDIELKTLYRLTSTNTAFNEWIVQLDHKIYSAIETGLLPDLLSPVPRELNQEIRQFAKNVGPWMDKAVCDYHPSFASAKSRAARALGYTLRRYTALNHLATSARPVWDSKVTMQRMYMDLSRVDLKDVQHQATLITRCDSSISTQVVLDFMNLINSSKPSESWHEWCNVLVESKLRGDDIDSARHFILKWNFYSSLIMKDLTLRSSTSFGSFHLIRLLFDEYIFYLIVCHLAKSHGKTPTQLLCEANDWISSDSGQTI